MANRYWVGGSGNWSDDTHWAATSNGAPLSGQIIDSYTTTDTYVSLGDGVTDGVGQSFTGNGGTLKYAQFLIAKSGSPTGNAVVKVYAESHATAFGTDSLPNGAVLATSDNFDVSTLTDESSYPLFWHTFKFSGANQITLTNATKYVVCLEYTGGDGSNFVYFSFDETTVSHAGNLCVFPTGFGSYVPVVGVDLLFKVMTDTSVPLTTDNVIIDSNSGLSSGTLEIDTMLDYSVNSHCHDFTSTTGFAYTIESSSIETLYTTGSIVLEASLTISITLVPVNTTSETLTTNGCISLNYVQVCSGTIVLQDNSVFTEFIVFSGTFDANNKNITSPSYYFIDDVGTVIINMGSGVWTSTDFGFVFLDLGTLTINSETSTLKFTETTDKPKYLYIDSGSSIAFNNIWVTGAGTGQYYILGDLIINDFKVDTAPKSIIFEKGKTKTITSWTVNGSAGNLVTINSTPDEVDSYRTNNTVYVVDNTTTKLGQTFTGIAGILNSAIFLLSYSSGTPTGNCYAKVYDITGTFGSTSVPAGNPGNPIATSDALLINSVDISDNYSFQFSGTNKITLSANTTYAVVFEWDDGTVADYVNLCVDTSTLAHTGNLVYYSGAAWHADAAKDLNFAVYVDSSTPATLAYAGTGTVACDYLDVTNITGSPRHTWAVGSHSTDSGNNTYLYFIDALHFDTFVTKGNSTFEVGDVLRIKDDTNDEWMEVVSVTDSSNYTVARDMLGSYSVGSFPSWKKGASIVNYRQSGDGGVYMTASDTNAPYIEIFDHAGDPWNDVNTRLRIGNLNGYLGYNTDLYGIAIGETDKYLKYDPTNGLRLKSDHAELDIGTTGYLKGGQTDYATGTGFFIGYSNDYKLSIGSTINYLRWDGTYLKIGGSIDVGSNGIINNSTYTVATLPIPPAEVGFNSPSAIE